MNRTGWIFGCMAAVVGGAALAALLITVGRDLKIASVAVGAIVGGALLWKGSRDNGAAVIAVLLTLVAIAGGRFVATASIAATAIETHAHEDILDASAYKDFVEDEQVVSQLAEPGKHAEFIETWQYAKTEDGKANDEELAIFREFHVDLLRELATSKPPYEQARPKLVAATQAELRQRLTPMKAFIASLDLDLAIQVLFGLIVAGALAARPRREAVESEA